MTDPMPQRPADGGAFLTDADLRHDQDEFDEAEADRQLAAVDEEEDE